MSKPISPKRSYQSLFQELLQCIEQLDKGNMPIHQAITQYQHSLELKQECASKLEQAEFVLSISSNAPNTSSSSNIESQTTPTATNIEEYIIKLQDILESMQQDAALENNILHVQQGQQLGNKIAQILQTQERELTILQPTEDVSVPNFVTDTDVISYDLFDHIE